MKTTIFIVLAMLCLNFSAIAQVPQPLNLGQKIPASILNQTFPIFSNTSKPTDSLSLNQFKGKLILLDFWATWCANCIQKFEMLAQFQQQYADQFQVLLVNAKNSKDTPKRMLGILSGEKAPFIKANLISIYNDTTLNRLFPHSYLPHYVWIGAKGEVLALTGADLVNEQTIRYFLADIKKQQQKALAELSKKP